MGQTATVGNPHGDFIAGLGFKIEDAISQDQIAAADREDGCIGAAVDAVGGGVAGILIGGGQGTDGGPATGVGVLIDAAARQGHQGRRFVDIGHGDQDRLDIGARVAVIGGDFDFVDTIGIGIGKRLKILGRVKRQHAACGDGEQALIGAAGDGKGRGVAIGVSRGDGGNSGLVLGRRDRSRLR